MSFVYECLRRQDKRFSVDLLTDPEVGVAKLMDMAERPEDLLTRSEFEEITEETSGQLGGNSMRQRNLGSNPGASINLSSKYCYKTNLFVLIVRHFIRVTRF